jgi:uncharacterized membrane protein YbhN (UPF0104 family)
MIPGGVGSQDVTMAALLSLFGVNLGIGILAIVLFRVGFYFVPYFVSLVIYGTEFGRKSNNVPSFNYN